MSEDLPFLSDSDHSNIVGVLASFESRLGGIEAKLERLNQAVKSAGAEKLWYSTSEIAEILGKAEFTTREWARHGRIHAEKRQCGRGAAKEWMISATELKRIQNEGLLPDAKTYHHVK